MTAVLGWTLIVLCTLGVSIAAWGWWFVTSQVRKDDLMRQQVREALEGSVVLEPGQTYEACLDHNTVFTDFCPDCKVEAVVALTRPGYVVHS